MALMVFFYPYLSTTAIMIIVYEVPAGLAPPHLTHSSWNHFFYASDLSLFATKVAIVIITGFRPDLPTLPRGMEAPCVRGQGRAGEGGGP